jgi:hypothetical protein
LSIPSRRVLVAAAFAAAAVFAGACGKPEAPGAKVDAATEKAEAHKRALEGPLGSQVKSLDDAKKLQEDLNKKATENVDRIEKDAK